MKLKTLFENEEETPLALRALAEYLREEDFATEIISRPVVRRPDSTSSNIIISDRRGVNWVFIKLNNRGNFLVGEITYMDGEMACDGAEHKRLHACS